jgi:hypothetical protein
MAPRAPRGPFATGGDANASGSFAAAKMTLFANLWRAGIKAAQEGRLDQDERFRWANDAVEVAIIFAVFALVYTAIGIGALGAPVIAGFRRLRSKA